MLVKDLTLYDAYILWYIWQHASQKKLFFSPYVVQVKCIAVDCELPELVFVSRRLICQWIHANKEDISLSTITKAPISKENKNRQSDNTKHHQIFDNTA